MEYSSHNLGSNTSCKHKAGGSLTNNSSAQSFPASARLRKSDLMYQTQIYSKYTQERYQMKMDEIQVLQSKK